MEEGETEDKVNSITQETRQMLGAGGNGKIRSRSRSRSKSKGRRRRRRRRTLGTPK